MVTSLSRGILLFGLVLASLGASVPVGTAKAARCTDSRSSRGEAPQLCGRTTFRASSVAAISVVLPEPAMLSVPAIGRWRFNRPGSNVWLEGGGGFSGFVIESAAKGSRSIVLGGRIGGSRGWDFFNSAGFRRIAGGIELPPGPYRITLAPSRGELELTIDLPSFGEAVTYSASDPVSNQIFVGRLGDPLAGDAGVYSFGMNGPLLTQESLGLAAIWGTASRHLATAAGTCFYGPGSDSTDEHKYLPGCPSRGPNVVESRQTIVAAPPEEDGLVAHLKLAPGLPPGAWGIGAWMTAQQGLKGVKIALVWIDLNR